MLLLVEKPSLCVFSQLRVSYEIPTFEAPFFTLASELPDDLLFLSVLCIGP